MNATINGIKWVNINPGVTGPATAAHLKSQGWDGTIYNATSEQRTPRSGLLYRNAKTGEFTLVASVKG